MNRLCALLTGLWLGMQIMAGYVAAPILFETAWQAGSGEHRRHTVFDQQLFRPTGLGNGLAGGAE